MQTALSRFEAGRTAHEQGDVSTAYEEYAQAYRLVKGLGTGIDGLLDAFAELCVTVGDAKQAKTLYREAIRNDPGGGPQRYLALAQLETGTTAVRMYLQGIELLRTTQPTQSGDETPSVQTAVSTAFAALAELYMTDLCDERDAEEKCERYTQEAIRSDPGCVEGYQALASLRLIRGRLTEAQDALNQVIRILHTLGEATLPTPQFLSETARLLIELEAWSQVAEVTEIALHINEQSDLLYMNAFALYKLQRWEEAKDVLELLQERLKQEPEAEISEAAAELERESMEHDLEYEWTFWCTRTNVIKQVRSAEMWTQKVANIYTVRSLEEFWSVFNNLKNPSQLPTRGDYFFFKKGINPAWEDPVNAQGGAWQVTIPNPLNADDIWSDLLISLIGCQFPSGIDEICGTALGSRKNGIRLSIWTKTIEADKVVPLGNYLKQEVVKTKEPLLFHKHISEGSEGPLYTAE